MPPRKSGFSAQAKRGLPSWMTEPADQVGQGPKDPSATTLEVILEGTKPRWVNAEKSFAIWDATDTDGRPVTVKGALARAAGGEKLQCNGKWKQHHQHGWSFDVQSFLSALPVTEEGIINWLQTRVKGIGPVFAKAVVNQFGTNAFQIIDDNPEVLRDLRTLGGGNFPQKTIDNVIQVWADVRNMRQLEAFLYSYGISANLADRLYRQYGEDVTDILQKEPYRIADMRGIGFKTADKIARKMGIPLNDPNRLAAGLLFVLKEASGEGHVFLYLQQLVNRSAEALEVTDSDTLVMAATELANKGRIKVEPDPEMQQRVYLSKMLKMEQRLARQIRIMVAEQPDELFPTPPRPTAPDDATEEEIEALRLPTDEQWSIIDTVRTKRLSILKGGPGTGKCIRGDQLVTVNNALAPIEQIWSDYSGNEQDWTWDGEGHWIIPQGELFVPALNEQTGEIVSAKVTRLYRQPVYEYGRKVTLQDGNSIVMTNRHRLHGVDGWQRDIHPGDTVCVPQRLPHGTRTLSSSDVQQLSPASFLSVIPEYLLHGDEKSTRQMLRQLFEQATIDSETIMLSVNNMIVAQQLQMLLRRFSLFSTVSPTAEGVTIALSDIHLFNYVIAQGDFIQQGRLDTACLQQYSSEARTEGALQQVATRQTAVCRQREAFYVQVTDVQPILLDGYVYDFEVDQHHNYVAQGMITHNTHSQQLIVDAAIKADANIALCAPTGKAARRMTELTGHEASTIHRLLKWSPSDGGFEHDESNPLLVDLVIVDESSMLSLDLADALFRAVGDDTHVLLVGDTNQLPPVGVGKVLEDLINSEQVPQVHLRKIFRQAQRSMIISNAHRVNSGEMPFKSHKEAENYYQRAMLRDFYFVSRQDPAASADLTVEFAVERIPREFKMDPVKDVMVLAPMHKGACGLDVLNTKMQAALNPSGQPLGLHNMRVGDRIIQTKNDYTPGREIMNGEIAIILERNTDNGLVKLRLDDGEREVWLPLADMDTFYLAWACSVHKSQGSQFPAVVVPVSSAHYVMLSRALTYTAITRAEKLVVLVGEPQALSMAVQREDSRKRNSTLALRIRDPQISGELF